MKRIPKNTKPKKRKKTARVILMKSLAKKINADNVKIVSTEHTTENNNVQ